MEVAESCNNITRSAADIWLIGQVSEEIRRMKLPTHRQVPYIERLFPSLKHS